MPPSRAPPTWLLACACAHVRSGCAEAGATVMAVMPIAAVAVARRSFKRIRSSDQESENQQDAHSQFEPERSLKGFSSRNQGLTCANDRRLVRGLSGKFFSSPILRIEGGKTARLSASHLTAMPQHVIRE